MLNKLDIIKDSENCVDAFGDTHNVAGNQVIKKINELVDAVNELQIQLKPISEERESQIKVYEETMEMVKQNDPYAEQRKWIGCLVRYKITKSGQGGWYIDVLDEIVDHPIYPFKMRNGKTAEVCEVVEPNEIYPNKARTW